MERGVTSALLDTSVVIQLGVDASLLDHAVFTRYDALLVSSLTYGELQAGIAHATSAEVANSRHRLLENARLVFGEGLAFDDRSAVMLHEVMSEACSKVRRNSVDRMIAAVARAHGLDLLTLNADDLTGVAGVVGLAAGDERHA